MKVRCSRDSPRCNNCQKRNKPCTYASTHGTGLDSGSGSGPTVGQDEPMDIEESTDPSPYQTSSLTSELAPAASVTSEIIASPSPNVNHRVALPDEVATQLINKYFDCLSALPSFSFLHRDTVVQRCLDGSIDQSLKLAICAITSMFLDLHHSQRKDWAQESEKLILGRLEKPSIFLIQAALLTIRFGAAVGKQGPDAKQ